MTARHIDVPYQFNKKANVFDLYLEKITSYFFILLIYLIHRVLLYLQIDENYLCIIGWILFKK